MATRPVAIVTGASRGIGKAISLRLAREGFDLVLAARTEAALGDVAGDCLSAAAQTGESAGAKAVAVPTDVSREGEVRRLFETTLRELGRLDVLVNNAGIGVYGPVAGTTLADYERVMAVNARGTFLCSREAMRLMVPAGGGIIVNVSSVVGIKGYANQGAYTASKHAIVGLSKVLAEEGREAGVRVHVICPGGVATDLVADARPDIRPEELLQPEDVADLVAYLIKLPKRAMIDLIHLRRSTSKPF